ncbi:MAG: hypothetical protein IKF11_10040, partial [Methanobrevibacter sp.]|nr:hypothetical protein [Methanobrevibacter sp.]
VNFVDDLPIVFTSTSKIDLFEIISPLPFGPIYEKFIKFINLVNSSKCIVVYEESSFSFSPEIVNPEFSGYSSSLDGFIPIPSIGFVMLLFEGPD